MKKRLLSLLLVCSMLLSLLPVSAFATETQGAAPTVDLANPFTDVKESDWFYDAVQYARVNNIFSGTGAATALAAGATLQFMEWAVIEKNKPLINGTEIKNYFIRGARRDSNLDWPNRELGYGKLDIYEAFEVLRRI